MKYTQSWTRFIWKKKPLIVQRLRALRVIKQKEELISDCLRRIYDTYQSAQLAGCPFETMALLYLVTLLPYDSLAEKIKAYFVEKMRLQPNITSLDKVTAFILSQEADELDKRSTQSKANRVNRVDDKVDKVGPPRVKKYKCRICNKTHEKCQCGYTCEHCHRKGHRSEKCWIKFPNLRTSFFWNTSEGQPSLP